MKYITTLYAGSLALLLFILLISVFLAYALDPRIDTEGATQVLEAQGYTDIVITGWRQGAKTRFSWTPNGSSQFSPDVPYSL